MCLSYLCTLDLLIEQAGQLQCTNTTTQPWIYLVSLSAFKVFPNFISAYRLLLLEFLEIESKSIYIPTLISAFLLLN